MNQINSNFKWVCFILLFASCRSSSPIQRTNESESKFSKPTELISNNYPATDIYRIYEHAASGFNSISGIRQAAMTRIDQFANGQERSYIILGEQISHPPYITGNFPRIEIVFALIDKKSVTMPVVQSSDKYANLERLKKLLDEGAITKDEYEVEKKKILEKKE